MGRKKSSNTTPPAEGLFENVQVGDILLIDYDETEPIEATVIADKIDLKLTKEDLTKNPKLKKYERERFIVDVNGKEVHIHRRNGFLAGDLRPGAYENTPENKARIEKNIKIRILTNRLREIESGNWSRHPDKIDGIIETLDNIIKNK